MYRNSCGKIGTNKTMKTSSYIRLGGLTMHSRTEKGTLYETSLHLKHTTTVMHFQMHYILHPIIFWSTEKILSQTLGLELKASYSKVFDFDHILDVQSACPCPGLSPIEKTRMQYTFLMHKHDTKHLQKPQRKACPACCL